MCIQDDKITHLVSHSSIRLISMFPFYFRKPRKKLPSVNIAWQSVVKCQNSLSLNYDISAVYAPKDIIWEIFFSTFTLIRYLRSVVSPLNTNYFVYASPFLLLSHVWAQSHCFFPFSRKIYSFTLCIAMSETYIRGEKSWKRNFN